MSNSVQITRKRLVLVEKMIHALLLELVIRRVLMEKFWYAHQYLVLYWWIISVGFISYAWPIIRLWSHSVFKWVFQNKVLLLLLMFSNSTDDTSMLLVTIFCQTYNINVLVDTGASVSVADLSFYNK